MLLCPHPVFFFSSSRFQQYGKMFVKICHTSNGRMSERLLSIKCSTPKFIWTQCNYFPFRCDETVKQAVRKSSIHSSYPSKWARMLITVPIECCAHLQTSTINAWNEIILLLNCDSVCAPMRIEKFSFIAATWPALVISADCSSPCR